MKAIAIILIVYVIIILAVVYAINENNKLEIQEGLYVYAIEDLEGLTHTVSFTYPVIIDGISIKSLTLVAEGVSHPTNK